MRSRSIRYVKYLNELRMDMQLSCHGQEKGETEKEGERVRVGWHASLTSWHVQLEASACLTLLWLTATGRHTIYDIWLTVYDIVHNVTVIEQALRALEMWLHRRLCHVQR